MRVYVTHELWLAEKGSILTARQSHCRQCAANSELEGCPWIHGAGTPGDRTGRQDCGGQCSPLLVMLPASLLSWPMGNSSLDTTEPLLDSSACFLGHLAVSPSQCPNTKLHQGAVLSREDSDLVVFPSSTCSTQQSLYRTLSTLQGVSMKTPGIQGQNGILYRWNSQPRGSVFLIRVQRLSTPMQVSLPAWARTQHTPDRAPPPRCAFPPS